MKNKNKEYDSNTSAMWSGIKDLRYSRKRPDVQLQDSDRLDGKTVLITGASSGLGLATSIQLAQRGARVLMVCRREAEEERKLVERAGKGNGGSSEVVRADMSDFGSIRNLIDDLVSAGETVDVFISNAAVVPSSARLTKDGYEEMLQVNAFAPALFIRLLLDNDLLKSSELNQNGKPILPRIVVVASEAHRSTEELKLEDFGKMENYNMSGSTPRYGWTKLILLSWIREVSRRNKDIAIHALCPGPVASNIAREAPAIAQPFAKLFFSLFFQSPTKAAAPLVYLSASRAIEGETGHYQFLMRTRPPSDTADNPRNGAQVWDAVNTVIDPFIENKSAG